MPTNLDKLRVKTAFPADIDPTTILPGTYPLIPIQQQDKSVSWFVADAACTKEKIDQAIRNGWAEIIPREEEKMESAVVVRHGASVINFDEQAMPLENLKKQVALIQDVMRSVMKDGEHFGVIPGCGKKPSLLKPGAEKLSTVFRLAPAYQIQKNDLGNGHREYEIVCTLTHITTGAVVGQGVGSCSTLEAKYRYRTGPGESTNIQVPKKYWDTRKDNPVEAMKILREIANKAGVEGSKFGTKKDDAGVWYITTAADKVEHDNPADYFNTVLKMAKKRAHVDAVLTATAASDIFSQDLEDLPDAVPPAPTPGPKQTEQPKESTPEPISNEVLSVDFIPSVVLKKEGEKGGKSWVKFTIQNGEIKYATFSKKFAEIAKSANIEGKQIRVAYKAGKFGNDIELITLVEAQREPGE